MARELAASIVDMSVNAAIFTENQKEFRSILVRDRFAPTDTSRIIENCYDAYVILLNEGWRECKSIPMVETCTNVNSKVQVGTMHIMWRYKETAWKGAPASK